MHALSYSETTQCCHWVSTSFSNQKAVIRAEALTGVAKGLVLRRRVCPVHYIMFGHLFTAYSQSTEILYLDQDRCDL